MNGEHFNGIQLKWYAVDSLPVIYTFTYHHSNRVITILFCSMGIFSCCKGGSSTVAPSSMSSNQESNPGDRLKWLVDNESNKHNDTITPFQRDIHERSYHSSSSENDFDAYEDDEVLRGVSNAVYRKELLL